MSHLLIVEDEGIIRSALTRLLQRNGFQVSEAGTVAEAHQCLAEHRIDLIISDLRLPGESGTSLINPDIPVLIMTSYASLRSAVDTMKQGAVDYIAKPFDHDEMLTAINQILDKQKSACQQPVEACRNSDNDQPGQLQGMLGESPAMQKVFQQICKVAPYDSRVLILGESGTGKELVARALHALSPRKNGPLISVNCAAIPETLIESELFGHEKGAFTGANTSRNGLVEAADGGSLFLDEIGELPLDAQARLLRVLQEGEIRRLGSVDSRKVDIRLLAATHRDIGTLVEQGRFRLDLYYRLNVIEIELPNLADRGEDILLLAERLLQETTSKLGKPPMRLSKSARHALLEHTWPGNVRELENRIERAVILSEDTLLQADDLQLGERWYRPVGRQQPAALATEPLQTDEDPAHLPDDDLSLEDYFVRFVQENEDNLSETELARKLGISRKCLWERRQRLGIPRKRPLQQRGS